MIFFWGGEGPIGPFFALEAELHDLRTIRAATLYHLSIPVFVLKDL